MAMYFAFELEAVARRSLYLPQPESTDTIFEVSARIEAFRGNIEPRPGRPIPHLTVPLCSPWRQPMAFTAALRGRVGTG
jgi:hypothetical protein